MAIRGARMRKMLTVVNPQYRGSKGRFGICYSHEVKIELKRSDNERMKRRMPSMTERNPLETCVGKNKKEKNHLRLFDKIFNVLLLV